MLPDVFQLIAIYRVASLLQTLAQRRSNTRIPRGTGGISRAKDQYRDYANTPQFRAFVES